MTTDPIQKLKKYIKSGEAISPPKALLGVPNLDYSVDRFGLAYNGTLGPDEIVLLRQALRWSGMKEIGIERPSGQSEEMDQWFKNAGMRWTSSGFLSVEPYRPQWLEENPKAIDVQPKLRQPPASEEQYKAESYLKQMGYEYWRSQAQKESAWLVITAPGGSTRTVILPTGCGKSLCFQLLPLYNQGLTVVVVPTVALAIDQWRAACEQLKNVSNLKPSFFASDDNPESTVADLKNKNTRLIFASPETCVSGQLRPILNKFAREGWFNNLVIDEAHVIETWGAQFRVEFQILAAIRRQWLKASNNKLRTFLFSATMSTQCRKSLNEMFAEQGHAEEIACQRLRPEMSYFSRRFQNDHERWPYLKESLWRLPRPCILYTTKPIDAQTICERLKEEGFNRIGCFTGETRREERRNLLKQWKDNQIDLMVATSAFGLGVDKADIRTVIHACYPENLDRYYQEVGRSGRDGYSSICLFMPTDEDRDVACSLGITLMSEESIQERWNALYKQKREVEGGDEYTFELPIEAKRISLTGRRTYSENIKWNKRLFLQLHRAQLIELLDLKLEKGEGSEEDPREWATVKVKFSPTTHQLGDKMSSQRNRELRYFQEGFKQLEELLLPNKCVSRSLRKIYDIPLQQRVCGGCRFCRANKQKPEVCPLLRVPENECPGDHKGIIVEGWADPRSQKDSFIDSIEFCRDKHTLKPLQLYCPEKHFEEVLSMLEGLFGQYQEPYRIDPFTENTVLRFQMNRPILFLHIGEYSEKMLDESRKTWNSKHLFCSTINPYELNGRHIKIRYKFDSWLSPEAWLEHLI